MYVVNQMAGNALNRRVLEVRAWMTCIAGNLAMLSFQRKPGFVVTRIYIMPRDFIMTTPTIFLELATVQGFPQPDDRQRQKVTIIARKCSARRGMSALRSRSGGTATVNLASR